MLAGISAYADTLAEGPHLGVALDPDEIASWDFTIMPDGRALPPGAGSVKQGDAIYQKYCLVCHGEGAMGDSGEQLAGAQMALTSEWPEKTVGSYWPYATTLFDFIRRSMPMTAPGILSDDEVYALTAYLLYLYGIIAESDVMRVETLRAVNMPNRGGFLNIYEMDKRHD